MAVNRKRHQNLTPQKELKRTKKEIGTEIVKGTATTTAANIAEIIGTLFGSNKIKTLE